MSLLLTLIGYFPAEIKSLDRKFHQCSSGFNNPLQALLWMGCDQKHRGLQTQLKVFWCPVITRIRFYENFGVNIGFSCFRFLKSKENLRVKLSYFCAYVPYQFSAIQCSLTIFGEFYFSIWVFFHEHSRFTGQQGKGRLSL